MNEFELIQYYFAKHQKQDGLIQGIGDDCAILKIPDSYEVAISMDTLVAGVHFPELTSAYDIGYKALAVNLSDCAAMGAKPVWATLALTLPHYDETWLKDFSEGFFVMANLHGVSLIGGDTTRGPLSITIQIHGLLPKGKALLRSYAKPGDDIYVTGTLGDAGLALQTALGKRDKLNAKHQVFIESRLNQPTPRVQIGQALLAHAHACIDISDGLAADLNHILQASQVGAELDLAQLPLSPVLQSFPVQEAQHLALFSGDDYELCFTAPIECREQIKAISQQFNCPITRIGSIVAKLGLFANQQELKTSGFQHF